LTTYLFLLFFCSSKPVLWPTIPSSGRA